MHKSRVIPAMLAALFLVVAFAAACYASDDVSPTPTLTPAPPAQSDLSDEVAAMRDELNTLYEWIQNRDQSAAYEPTPAPATEKPTYSPLVKLSSPLNAVLTPGKSAMVEATVKNVGSTSAVGVLVQASMPSNAPFSFSFNNNSNNLSSIREGGTASFTLNITPDAGAATGTYDLALKFSYKDEGGLSKTDEDILQIRILNLNPATSASPIIRSFTVSPSAISDGQPFVLDAVLANQGTAEMTGVRVEIEGASGIDGGVTPSGESVIYFGRVGGSSEEKLSFAMSATKGLKDGTYPVVLKLVYAGGPEGGLSWTYYVPVSGTGAAATGNAKVEIASVDAPQGAYGVSETFNVTLTVANTSSDPATNVKVSASSGEGGEIVPMSASIQTVAVLGAGESREMTFSFAPSASAKSQNYMIGFTVSYETGAEKDGAKETVSFEQFAGVIAYNPTPTPEPSPAPSPEPDKVSTPRIIISSYKTDPLIVQAGTEFGLDLEFMNTHKSKKIGNIKAVLTAVESVEQTGSVFMPVNGSNTIYLDEIEPGGTSGISLRMYAVPNALARTYSLLVSYNYQDGDFNNYEDSETIGISVKQVTKLEVGDYTVPSEGYPYQPVYFFFNIINSGKVNLNNLRVTVEADMDVSSANMFLGALKTGSSIYYEGTVTPEGPGRQDIKVIVSCEDDNGEILTDVRTFAMEVMEEPAMDAFVDMPMETVEEGGSILGFLKNPFVIGGGTIALIAVVVIIVIAVRRKRQKGWLEDE